MYKEDPPEPECWMLGPLLSDEGDRWVCWFGRGRWEQQHVGVRRSPWGSVYWSIIKSKIFSDSQRKIGEDDSIEDS